MYQRLSVARILFSASESKKRGNAFILVQSGGYEASISGTHVSVMSLTVNPKETLVSRRAAA